MSRIWKVHKQFNPELLSPELFPPAHQHRSDDIGHHVGHHNETRSDPNHVARFVDSLIHDGLMVRGMPSARDYFDDGPRGRSVSAGGSGEAWAVQGYEHLPPPPFPE